MHMLSCLSQADWCLSVAVAAYWWWWSHQGRVTEDISVIPSRETVDSSLANPHDSAPWRSHRPAARPPSPTSRRELSGCPYRGVRESVGQEGLALAVILV